MSLLRARSKCISAAFGADASWINTSQYEATDLSVKSDLIPVQRQEGIKWAIYIPECEAGCPDTLKTIPNMAKMLKHIVRTKEVPFLKNCFILQISENNASFFTREFHKGFHRFLPDSKCWSQILYGFHFKVSPVIVTDA